MVRNEVVSDDDATMKLIIAEAKSIIIGNLKAERKSAIEDAIDDEEEKAMANDFYAEHVEMVSGISNVDDLVDYLVNEQEQDEAECAWMIMLAARALLLKRK